MLNRTQVFFLATLASAVSAAIYGVATYQMSYGCISSNGVIALPNPPQGSSINWQVLGEACFYVYFVGIVGGSIFLILLIPANKKPIGVRLNPP